MSNGIIGTHEIYPLFMNIASLVIEQIAGLSQPTNLSDYRAIFFRRFGGDALYGIRVGLDTHQCQRSRFRRGRF